MNERLSPAEIQHELRHFSGGDTVFKHWTGKVNYSEGVQWLADKAGAHWLLDVIASHQTDPKVRKEEFQVWKLTKTGTKAELVCEDGNDNKVTSQRIGFTDFPLGEIELYCEFGTIMLPSER